MIDTTTITFWQAIDSGDADAVRDHLNRRPGLASASRAGLPAAHTAVRRGHTAVARLLVHRGADLIARDRDGLTLPERAAFEGSRRMLETLLFEMPALGFGRRSRSTLFLWAVAGGNVRVASYLLGCGADPQVRDAMGRTAVDWALRHGQPGLAAWLTRQGVRPSSATAEHAAAMSA